MCNSLRLNSPFLPELAAIKPDSVLGGLPPKTPRTWETIASPTPPPKGTIEASHGFWGEGVLGQVPDATWSWHVIV